MVPSATLNHSLDFLRLQNNAQDSSVGTFVSAHSFRAHHHLTESLFSSETGGKLIGSARIKKLLVWFSQLEPEMRS